MATIGTRTCPNCKSGMVLALPSNGKGPRTLQCIDCDRPDPLKSEKATAWLKSELQPPKDWLIAESRSEDTGLKAPSSERGLRH
jgi:hypothetical protein